MIEEYSKTIIRLYPTDKKILYRANSLKSKFNISDLTQLTKAVNKSFEEDIKEGKKTPKLPISEQHISDLLNGTNAISVNMKSNRPGDPQFIDLYDYTPDGNDMEKNLINKDLLTKISIIMENFTVIERKIIRLKGVDL